MGNLTNLIYTSLLTLLLAIITGPIGNCQPSLPDGSKESESVTIAKCLEDLKSEKEDLRKRAVLILGKYSNSKARNAIIHSLKDKSPSIRRSALVSLTEKPLSRTAVEPILFMIGDPDIHIRRIASSYIPELMRSWGIRRPLALHSTQNKKFSPKLSAILTKAFNDKDAIVRKNMITNYNYFRQFISPESLQRLLSDPDRDVRVLALNAGKKLLSPKEFIDAAATLSSDPDRTIRLQLAQILKNNRDDRTKEILNQLTNDEDFSISTEAHISLFHHSGFSDFQVLRDRLDDSRMDSQRATNIIQLIPLMGSLGEKTLGELILHPNSFFKETAIETYGRTYINNAEPGIFIELLKEPSLTIRRAATNILVRIPQVTAKHLAPLVFSEYSDVRKTLLQISPRLGKEEAKELLMELILDDKNSIRMLAIEQILRRQIDGWKSIAKASLEDDNPEIQQKTITLLTRSRSKDAKNILNEFFAKSL